MSLVYGLDSLVGPWVCDRAGGAWVDGRGSTIGIERDGILIAGVIYEDYNGANLIMHVASDGSRTWLNPDILFHLYDYPFNQLGCKRVTALVGSGNERMNVLALRLGFSLDAILKDAHPDGDMIVYKMLKEDCRWIRRKMNV